MNRPFSCGKDFGAKAIGRDGSELEKSTTSVSIKIGGFIQGWQTVKLTKQKGKYSLHVEGMWSPTAAISGDYDLDEAKWDKVMKQLYEKCFIHEWKKNYDVPEGIAVCDGTQWEIAIRYGNRRRMTIKGSNAFLPYWESFIGYLDKLKKGQI